MSSEAGKALKELALSIKTFSYPSNSAMINIQTCKKAVDEVNSTLQASMVGEWVILEIIPIITVISILNDIIKCVETIFEAIEELSEQAHFKKSEPEKPQILHGGAVAPVGDKEHDSGFVTIIIHKIAPQSVEIEAPRG